MGGDDPMIGPGRGSARPPRYAPNRPLPPYAFVPGRWPHPLRDPDGHGFAAAEERVVLDPEDPRACRTFLEGIDCFNHGYYWEAHEQWEAIWNGAGRHGPVAELAQGLIKLAAACVKVRQGYRSAARSLATAAAEQLAELGREHELFAGVDLDHAHRLAVWLAERAAELPADPSAAVEVVLPESVTLA